MKFIIKKFKQNFWYRYKNFYEQEYVSVLNSIRMLLCIVCPFLLYVFTNNLDFIWLGLCCFLWAFHIFAQNNVPGFLRSMFISLAICTGLQVVGFLAHINIISYCAFSFLIAFLIPYFGYFKKVVLYSVSTYFIVQNSVFFEKDISEMSKSILYSILAFFIVIIIDRYIIPINRKKQMMYRLKVNLDFLLHYLDQMKLFILHGTKKDYELLGQKRALLLKSVQLFRDIYPQYVAQTPQDILAKIAPIQERFIESTVGFCVQIRNIHVERSDGPYITEIFKKIRDTILRQRGLVFEVKVLNIQDLQLRYQNIFAFVKNIEVIRAQDTHLHKTELDEMNFAIFQFKESIALMEKDIQKCT